jgi:hypothetical protein
MIFPRGSGLEGVAGISYLYKRVGKGGFRMVKLQPAHQVTLVASPPLTAPQRLADDYRLRLQGEQLIVLAAGVGGWGNPVGGVEPSEVGARSFPKQEQGRHHLPRRIEAFQNTRRCRRSVTEVMSE